MKDSTGMILLNGAVFLIAVMYFWVTQGVLMAQSFILVYIFLIIPIFFVGLFATQDVDREIQEQRLHKSEGSP